MEAPWHVLQDFPPGAPDQAGQGQSKAPNTPCMFRSPKLLLQVPPTALRSRTILESKGSCGQRATSAAMLSLPEEKAPSSAQRI